MRAPRIQQFLSPFLRKAPAAPTCQARWLHKTREAPAVPSPIPLVPDVPTLLKVLGRGLSQHVDKFPSWEALFTLSSTQLRELGLEPPRTRRYLLTWLDRYRRGAFGVGGDFKHVENGEAYLKIIRDPVTDKKLVVNVPAGTDVKDVPADKLTRPSGYTVRGLHTITGPHALPLKAGEGARVVVAEGMWEHKQGHKVDGGERRKAEVRFKKRIAARRAEREAQGLR
ncbi:IGR protein domain-containing protein [Colletotrichum navitas]|uniref:Small ribosomal subunit protein mS41 n=1 Tax=Colletotrichum navitas TaxID=681940 RepID=A0AAD8Q4R1_9PEZI|nr:IGR protein domain-containing protein [Colletotrichum navitas]KAK1594809.1 IGR protein domain-containing protein [Colletotrichum navitas]